MKVRITKSKFGVFCSMPGLIAMLLLIFYPVAYNVQVSLLRYDNISPVKFIGLKNYTWLFSSPDFYLSWKVSAIYSLGGVGLAFIFGLILAHSLRKITVGKAVFRTLVILPWAVPAVISGFMWKWILNGEIGVLNYILSSLGLIDDNLRFISDPTLAMISGIIANAYIRIPFFTIFLLAGLESIPTQVYEAAKIDGADQLGQFRYISLPLNRFQMIVATVISLMFSFRTPDVFFSITGGGPGKATYHAGLFLMDTFYKFATFGHGGAVGMVLFMTIIAFAFPALYYGILRRGKS